MLQPASTAPRSAAPASPNGQMQISPGKNAQGEGVFSVIVKRSYCIVPGRAAQRREQDHPLRLTDSYFDGGDPQDSTVDHESEVAPFKAASDVVIIGRAYAPAGQTVQSMVAGARVGERKKLLRITGDRFCHWRAEGAPAFSDPLPFAEMPLRYDLAYGGRDEISDPSIPFFYPRNDMGKGVALRNLEQVVQGLALPNIEDPDDLLTPERVVIEDPARWITQPLPAGLGWRQRTWYPRSALLGSLPPFMRPGDVSAEERMGLLPADHVALAKQFKLPPYEARFNNGASLGLIFTTLKGDEEVGLRGLTPGGALDFKLPGDVPRIALDIGAGARELEPRIHTVSIRPDDMELDIIWRGALVFGDYAALARVTRLQAVVL